MAKVVYNACYGGFSLSREAVLLGRKLSGNPNWNGPCIKGDFYEKGIPVEFDYCHLDDDISRDDPILVQVVEQLGFNKASGECARLRVVEMEAGTKYRIDEYDGYESIEFADQIEWSVAK